MKKLLFLLFLGFLTVSANAQVKWDYPFKPGSEKWKSFNTHAEMVDACKIPDNTLDKMTTAELLETWENFPLKFDVFACNDLQKGFDHQKEICSALKLLLLKKDVGEVVLKRYKEAKTAEKQIYEKQHPEISINDYVASFITSYTVLSSTNCVITSYTLQQK